MDPTAIDYNPLATIQPATNALGYPMCNYGDPIMPDVLGCTNPISSNYNPAANVDDGSCLPGSPGQITGCTNPGAINYNPAATVDDGTCQFEGDTTTPTIPTTTTTTTTTTAGPAKDNKLLMYLGIGVVAYLLLKK